MTTVDDLQSSSILSSFLEITGVDTVQTARHFLDATDWKLDEAIQLFFIRGSDNQCPVPSFPSRDDSQSNASVTLDDEGQVLAPLPVRRETLYDGEKEEILEEGDSLLGWIHPPPIDLMFKGKLDEAKKAASKEKKLLLVNLQSKKEFNSHLLNLTWSNEAVAQILKENFIFLQVSDDTIVGRKFSYHYNLLGSIPPVVLLLDPITGQKICSWNGMIEGEKLMELFVPFMDADITGKQQQQSSSSESTLNRSIVNQEEEEKGLMLAMALSTENLLINGDPVCPSTSTNTEMDEESSSSASEEEEEDSCLMEEEKKRVNAYPALPEEPKTVDRKLVCRVGFRLPQDGRRVQRCFLGTDPIQLVWSFIISQLDEAEVNRPFRLIVPQGIPGAASKALDYESNLNIEESGLSNSMVLVSWDD